MVPQFHLKQEGGAEDSGIQYSNELFSVSTDWSYLYLLGKLCIKFNMNMKDGVQILSDCMEIMKLFGLEGCTSFYKCKYWIAYALLVSGYKRYMFLAII